MTYTVIIDGYKWAYGLSEFRKEGDIALLEDIFPGSNILAIKELS
jgi:hypothetical protein